MIDQLKQDKWFVDVRGDIRGPICSWEIIQQLIAGDLKVIHRVSRDQTNWKGICNDEYFEKAIHTAIDFYSGKAGSTGGANLGLDSDEDTGFSNLGDISKGISAQLNHAQDLQEINVGLNSLRKLLAEVMHNRKVVIEATPTVVDEVHPDDRHVYMGMQTGDRPSLLGRNKFLTAVLLIGFLALGGLKFLEYQDKREAAALDAQLKGLQKEKALQGYEKALGKANDFNSTQLLDLAEQEIGNGNMSFGSQLLNRAIEVASVGPDKARAHSLLGYIAVQSKDLESAAKSYESSLKSSQKIYLTYHNYGVLNLKLGEFEKAEALFLKAMQLEDGPKDRSPTIFGLVEAAIQLDMQDNTQAEAKLLKSKEKEKYIPIFSRMNKAGGFLGRVGDFYVREKLLTELYMDHVRKRKKLDRSKLLKFLKVEDEKLKKVQGVAGLDVSRIQWTHLYSWCLPIYNSDRRAVHLNALFGYCVLRSRGAEAAQPYIEFAAQKAPYDPIYKRYSMLVRKALKAATTDSSQSPKGI